MQRSEFLDSLVSLLPKAVPGQRTIVGIDGRDGVGKTSLADELAIRMAASGNVARASLDDFHHPRAHRYRQGQGSGVGYWEDAFDIEAIVRQLLQPWHTGRGPWRAAVHDVMSDERVALPGQSVPGTGVLIVDGVFLARPELLHFWTTLILLDAPLAVSQARGAARYGPPPHASDPNDKYATAHALYRAVCDPVSRADILIDATSLDEPRIIRDRRVLQRDHPSKGWAAQADPFDDPSGEPLHSRR